MTRVTLKLLRVGECRHPQAATIRGGGLRPVVFPALSALIRHPSEGWILFDTGYDPRFLAVTERLPERAYRWLTPVRLAEDEAVVAQLAARGIAAGDVGHVVVSHFHADHVAGLHHFPTSRVHCARAGLDHVAGRGRLGALAAGMPKGLLPEGLARQARFFEDAPRRALPAELAPFEDGADMLGDGSLLAVELPGHCPGHWGLVVRAEDGTHFLVGDAAWSSAAIRTNTPPPAAVASLLGDSRCGRETLGRLHDLGRRNPDVVLTPSHCRERLAGSE